MLDEILELLKRISEKDLNQRQLLDSRISIIQACILDPKVNLLVHKEPRDLKDLEYELLQLTKISNLEHRTGQGH